jgi:uncharacterized membrane protein YphA (DoxX/SURF4 family)
MLFAPLAPLADPTFAGIVLRALLCSAYIWSGVTKLIDFNATSRHFANRFRIKAPRTAVAATIVVQLAGSAMFILGWRSAIAAMVLAAFTMAATFIAYPFWSMTGVERMRNIETFLEHVGLSAAFLLLAWPLAHL